MVRDFSQKTVQELYETIRVNVDDCTGRHSQTGRDSIEMFLYIKTFQKRKSDAKMCKM